MGHKSETERLPPGAAYVVLLKAAIQKLEQGDTEAARLLLLDLLSKLDRGTPVQH